MNEQRFEIAGSLVFWQFGQSSELNRLRAALELHGFGDHCPERMTDGAALRAALAEEFPGCKIFPVVSEKDKDAFEVVRVVADDKEKNSYEHVLAASLTEHVVYTDNYDRDQILRLQTSFVGFVSTVPASQLTKTMVAIVMSLGGVTMRPSGGIYWLNVDHWEKWQALCASIEACGPKNRFDACRVVFDQNCIEAIKQALTNEIAREAKLIEETLNDPETGLRAAATAEKRAQALRSKISSYEEAFGVALSELHHTMDEATTIAAKAALMDSARAMLEYSQS